MMPQIIILATCSLSVQINGPQPGTRLSFQPPHFSSNFKYIFSTLFNWVILALLQNYSKILVLRFNLLHTKIVLLPNIFLIFLLPCQSSSNWVFHCRPHLVCSPELLVPSPLSRPNLHFRLLHKLHNQVCTQTFRQKRNENITFLKAWCACQSYHQQ